MYSHKTFKIFILTLLINQASAQDRLFKSGYEENSAPFVTFVELTPEIANKDSLLLCSPTADDIDWDNLNFDYEWVVNDTTLVLQTAATLNGNHFNRDDPVKCNVMAFDGQDTSNIVESNTINIVNTPPKITSVTIGPTVAYETSTLSCNANGVNDKDSDTVTMSYLWTKNGTDIVNNPEPNINGSSFDKLDKISCTVTPNDGIEPGIPVQSTLKTIQNSIPILSSVSISPSSIDAFTTATCNPGLSSDVDSDSIVFSYKWFVNNTQISSTNSLNSTNFNEGDFIKCSVIPFDGQSSGGEVFSSTLEVAPPD